MQKQVQMIQAQSAQAGKSRATLEKEREKALQEKQKAEAAKRAKEEAALLKPVQVQKVPFGVDPKTVLCAFYKAGTCEKGNKCKFSHDMNIGRKVEKKNLYADTREEKLAGAYTVTALRTLIMIKSCRYHGELGRREAAERCAFKARQPTNYNRRMLIIHPSGDH